MIINMKTTRCLKLKRQILTTVKDKIKLNNKKIFLLLKSSQLLIKNDIVHLSSALSCHFKLLHL